MGNEPENPRQKEYLEMYEESLPQMKSDVQINSYLNAYGVTFDELTQMVHGLLEDKSNYGDTDRECREEDLNTTIPVRGDGWTGITPPTLPKGEVKGWFTLQGIRINEPSRKGVYIHNGKLILH